MATKNLYKAAGGVDMVSGKKGNQVQAFDNPSNMNRDKIDYFAQEGIEMVDDTLEFSMMKKGGSVKKKKNIWSLKVLFFISRKRLLNKLLSGKATIKEFNFYKLMLLIKSLEGN